MHYRFGVNLLKYHIMCYLGGACPPWPYHTDKYGENKLYFQSSISSCRTAIDWSRFEKQLRLCGASNLMSFTAKKCEHILKLRGPIRSKYTLISKRHCNIFMCGHERMRKTTWCCCWTLSAHRKSSHTDRSEFGHLKSEIKVDEVQQARGYVYLFNEVTVDTEILDRDTTHTQRQLLTDDSLRSSNPSSRHCTSMACRYSMW